MRLLAGIAVLLLAACTTSPPTPRTEPVPARQAAVPPVLAYATSTAIRVVHGSATIAEVDLTADEYVTDAEWTPDAARLLVATSTRLFSVDTTSGEMATARCECDSIAVVGAKVYAIGGYSATEMARYDLATLRPDGTVRPDLGGARGLLSVDGAGERLVQFRIVADGARPISDVVVFDPATGATTTVGNTGDIGSPSDSAYTPRGWRDAPVYAYIATGTTSAWTGTATVVWFDPTSPAPQVVTTDRQLRAESPDVRDAAWSSARSDLWWAADGTIRTTAHTWKCESGAPLSRPTCTDLLPRQQWRYDGVDWTRTDDRDLATVRDLANGTSVELDRDGRLFLVDGERKPLASEVERLWTPALPAAPVEPGSQAMAERFAPEVWLHGDEANFPADASDFVRRSTLRFDHGAPCGDPELVAAPPDEAKLGSGEHTHPAARLDSRDCPHRDDVVYRSDVVVKEGGGKGFILDLDDDDARDGNKPVDGVVTAPVYWEYWPGDRPGRGVYVYWFFYAYNDFNNKHEADWERVGVQVDGDRATGVAFSKHNVPACQVVWDRLDTHEGRPVVLSAKGSHASYAFEGDFSRTDGQQLGTDSTRRQIRWPTWTDVRDLRTQPWYGYRGWWGDMGLISYNSGILGPYPKRDMSALLSTSPCTEQVGRVPKDWVGTWKAERVQDPMGAQDPRAVDYSAEITIRQGGFGEAVGTASYPGLGCTGSLKLERSTQEAIVLRETREPDPADRSERCRTAGHTTITATPTGLSYRFVPDRRPGPITADLVRG
ncbi:hypothetical protein [Actinokineospora fastidiosa]|uniref:hypothetical protein n=1 Tax=Actinokineospora fastidiosa TaxID=1816 RepID=UPI001670F8E7|nr:hypothetical protein [Actinokineospora fastidiosa]